MALVGAKRWGGGFKVIIWRGEVANGESVFMERVEPSRHHEGVFHFVILP